MGDNIGNLSMHYFAANDLLKNEMGPDLYYDKTVKVGDQVLLFES
jgi:hypothetical protein